MNLLHVFKKKDYKEPNWTDLPRESLLEFIRAKHSESNTLVAHYKEKITKCIQSMPSCCSLKVKPLHTDITIVKTT